jgi:hypothetical protein
MKSKMNRTSSENGAGVCPGQNNMPNADSFASDSDQIQIIDFAVLYSTEENT